MTDPILGYDVGFYVFTLPVLEQARSLAAGPGRAGRRPAPARCICSAARSAITPFGVRIGERARRHLGLLDRAAARAAGAPAPGSIGRARCSRRPASSRAPATPTCTRGCRPRWRGWPRRWSAPAWPWPTPSPAVRWRRSPRVGVLRRRPARRRSSMPGDLQRFVVTPNEQVRETPFIEYNIAATRAAFALDRVEERELTGDAALTRADIDANRATLDNVRLWDHQPLLETFGQIQEIRTYYDFVVGRQRPLRDQRPEPAGDAVGARAEPGGAAQPHVGQRAPGLHARPRPDARARSTRSRAKACRCCSSATCRRCRRSTCTITEPSIYFGELVERLRDRPDRARSEFHYPKGEDNVYTDYDGTGGVAARLVLAQAAVRGRASATTRSC